MHTYDFLIHLMRYQKQIELNELTDSLWLKENENKNFRKDAPTKIKQFSLNQRTEKGKINITLNKNVFIYVLQLHFVFFA